MPACLGQAQVGGGPGTGALAGGFECRALWMSVGVSSPQLISVVLTVLGPRSCVQFRIGRRE